MPLRKVSDSSGTSMTVMDIDGYLISNFPVEDLENEFRSISRWNARDEDILIAAYPKSGTHWVWEIINMLIRRDSTLSDVNKESTMLEANPQTAYNAIKSPRVLNTHIYPNHLPEEMLRKRCKIIQVLRNPKDIAVSYFNHHTKIAVFDYDGKWEDYLHMFIEGNLDYGSWFDCVKVWEQFRKTNPDYPIHTVYYEDMKQNGIEEVGKLAEFLEMEHDQTFYKAVYESCRFDRMKEQKNKIKDFVLWKDGIPGMYRKGEIGDWKNWFTVAQNEEFNTVYKQRMQTSDVKIRFDKN